MRLVSTLRLEHEVAVACPDGGPLAEAVSLAGIDRFTLPPVAVSMRLHPVETPVGIAALARGGLALASAARRSSADIIHANTLRVGLMATVAARVGAPPVVVQTHDRLVPSALGRAVRAMVLSTAREVVAVSDYTAGRFNAGLGRPVATRVYNSIDHNRFDADAVEPAPLRQDLGIAADGVLLGHVAQVTPWKGQDTSIRVVAQLRREGLDAHLLIVGGLPFTGKGVRYDNRAYLRSLGDLVDELGVRPAVHFLGQQPNVPEIMRALDLTLLPSWDEPFGLVTVESMAVGTPPLVSVAGAGPELVEDWVTGRLLPPKRPEAWAAAVRELVGDPPRLAAMGRSAREASRRFRDDAQAREMLEVYARALGQAPPESGSVALAPAPIREPAGEVLR